MLPRADTTAKGTTAVYKSQWMADEETQPGWEAEHPRYKKAVPATRAFLKAGK